MFRKLILILLPVFLIPFFLETSYGYGSKLETGYGYGSSEKTKSFSGILVDTKCYGMNNDNFTNDHGKMKGCAVMCAKMGIPVGLLIDGKKGGKVYVLATPAPALADYMGEWARVSGVKAFKRGLIPKKIEIKKGDTYEEIKIETMM